MKITDIFENNFTRITEPCPKCKGKGTHLYKICPLCGGTATIVKKIAKEARVPGLGYEEIVKNKKTDPYIDRVILTLQAKDSEIMTKLAFKYKKLDNIMKAITKQRDEMNKIVKEKMVELFDAEDEFRTRVIETVSATMTLAKKSDPTPASVQVKIDYEKVTAEIMSLLDTELLEKAKTILTTYTTIERLPEQPAKSPALRVEPKESVNEALEIGDNVTFDWHKKTGLAGSGKIVEIYKDHSGQTVFKIDVPGHGIIEKRQNEIISLDRKTPVHEAYNLDKLKAFAHKMAMAFKSWGAKYDKKLATIKSQLGIIESTVSEDGPPDTSRKWYNAEFTNKEGQRIVYGYHALDQDHARKMANNDAERKGWKLNSIKKKFSVKEH